jgi:hypothetical protein
MTEDQANEILEQNGYAKHTDAVACLEIASDWGYVEGRASRQAEVDRLRKALNRAQEALELLGTGQGSWYAAKMAQREIKAILGDS